MEVLSKMRSKNKALTLDQKIAYIKKKGWEQYYNPNYWVHPKTVEDKTRQDYTNYGFNAEEAYIVEKNKLYPFPFTPLPGWGIKIKFYEYLKKKKRKTPQQS